MNVMAVLHWLIDGGPTAIRTRVTSSASSCDIQATLWVQRLLDGRVRLNPDGWNHIERGRRVFQLGWASFFDFGPVIGCGVLCVRTPCIPSTVNFTLSSTILSLSAVVACSASSSKEEDGSPDSFTRLRVVPDRLALGEKSKSCGSFMLTFASMTSRSRMDTLVISNDFATSRPESGG